MDNPKYAFYLRKSRADLEAEALGEGETLARHKNILYELANKKGIATNQIVLYQEIVSGESLQERPEALRLLKDVYQRKYKGVFVVEVERLARGNTKDQGEVADAFKYSNTFIITPVKTYDPNNEFDEEYFEFGLFMSRREYKTIRRRMETGRLESIKEGNYMGSVPPYGYDAVRINKKERTLVVNDEAPIVKMIFDWYTENGMTAGQIIKKLYEMGIPTRTGNKEWHRGSIYDILRNHTYYGYVRWNRRKCTKEMDNDGVKKKKRRNTPDDFMLIKGKHEPIITKEQFDKAQSLFSGAVPVKALTTISNPFAGIMVCKHCGKTMRYQPYNTRPNAIPRIVHTDSRECKVKSAPYTDVMDLVVESLRLHIENFEFELNNEHLQKQELSRQAELEAMQKELEKLRNKRKKLFDAYENDVYTDDEFIERKNIANTAINDLEIAMKGIKSTTHAQKDYKKMIVSFSEVLNALKDDKVSAKEKNTLLKSIIERIEYDCEDLGRGKGGRINLDITIK